MPRSGLDREEEVILKSGVPNADEYDRGV